MAPSSTQHQDISMALSTTINNYISANIRDGKVYAAPFAVFLNDNGCHGAPDFIIKIVSPSSRRMDYSIKQFKHCGAGIKEYWIVNLSKETITIYNYQKDASHCFTASRIL